MSEKEHQEIVIVRRRSGQPEGHHGGAWKIAFADFMTAMMALFLVLWLISSTSDKTKHAVAQYFNPVKLVDVTTVRKGFRDPKETEMGSGTSAREMDAEAAAKQAAAGAKDANARAGARAPTHAEAALFRDPYAVLAEIAGPARSETARDEPRAARGTEAAPGDLVEAFLDPFSSARLAPEPKARAPAASRRDKESPSPDAREESDPSDSLGPPESSQAPAPEIRTHIRPAPRRRETGAISPRVAEAEAVKLGSEIAEAVKSETPARNAPRVEVRGTDEGVLISLTDDLDYTMFAIGSAEPQKKTIEVMEKIGRLLKARAGAIVVRGHTDGRPYKSAAYDNWRLSAARAHMAHYMLVRGGLDEKRIERIEGHADRRLKFSADPTAPGNRRIEILLRKETP